MRLKYPSNTRIIRVPCTGKVDILHILHAFEKGADGIYIVGCLEGGCHFQNGNFRARKRVVQAQKILDVIGVGGERLQMYNLSSSEGTRFAQVATEMAKKISKIGPSPLKLTREKDAA